MNQHKQRPFFEYSYDPPSPDVISEYDPPFPSEFVTPRSSVSSLHFSNQDHQDGNDCGQSTHREMTREELEYLQDLYMKRGSSSTESSLLGLNDDQSKGFLEDKQKNLEGSMINEHSSSQAENGSPEEDRIPAAHISTNVSQKNYDEKENGCPNKEETKVVVSNQVQRENKQVIDNENIEEVSPTEKPESYLIGETNTLASCPTNNSSNVKEQGDNWQKCENRSAEFSDTPVNKTQDQDCQGKSENSSGSIQNSLISSSSKFSEDVTNIAEPEKPLNIEEKQCVSPKLDINNSSTFPSENKPTTGNKFQDRDHPLNFEEISKWSQSAQTQTKATMSSWKVEYDGHMRSPSPTLSNFFTESCSITPFPTDTNTPYSTNPTCTPLPSPISSEVLSNVTSESSPSTPSTVTSSTMLCISRKLEGFVNGTNASDCDLTTASQQNIDESELNKRKHNQDILKLNQNILNNDFADASNGYSLPRNENVITGIPKDEFKYAKPSDLLLPNHNHACNEPLQTSRKPRNHKVDKFVNTSKHKDVDRYSRTSRSLPRYIRTEISDSQTNLNYRYSPVMEKSNVNDLREIFLSRQGNEKRMIYKNKQISKSTGSLAQETRPNYAKKNSINESRPIMQNGKSFSNLTLEIQKDEVLSNTSFKYPKKTKDSIDVIPTSPPHVGYRKVNEKSNGWRSEQNVSERNTTTEFSHNVPHILEKTGYINFVAPPPPPPFSLPDVPSQTRILPPSFSLPDVPPETRPPAPSFPQSDLPPQTRPPPPSFPLPDVPPQTRPPPPSFSLPDVPPQIRPPPPSFSLPDVPSQTRPPPPSFFLPDVLPEIKPPPPPPPPRLRSCYKIIPPPLPPPPDDDNDKETERPPIPALPLEVIYPLGVACGRRTPRTPPPPPVRHYLLIPIIPGKSTPLLLTPPPTPHRSSSYHKSPPLPPVPTPPPHLLLSPPPPPVPPPRQCSKGKNEDFLHQEQFPSSLKLALNEVSEGDDSVSLKNGGSNRFLTLVRELTPVPEEKVSSASPLSAEEAETVDSKILCLSIPKDTKKIPEQREEREQCSDKCTSENDVKVLSPMAMSIPTPETERFCNEKTPSPKPISEGEILPPLPPKLNEMTALPPLKIPPPPPPPPKRSAGVVPGSCPIAGGDNDDVIVEGLSPCRLKERSPPNDRPSPFFSSDLQEETKELHESSPPSLSIPPPPPVAPSPPSGGSPNGLKASCMTVSSYGKLVVDRSDLPQPSPDEEIRKVYASVKRWGWISGYQDTLAIYTQFRPIIQQGPQCGLVALSMASHTCQRSVPVEELLTKGRQKGITCHGEMFNAEAMADLATESLTGISASVRRNVLESPEKVIRILLDGDLILFPYDSEPNHFPGLHKGIKSHWGLLCGCLVQSNGLDILRKQNFTVVKSDPQIDLLWHLRPLKTPKDEDQRPSSVPLAKTSEEIDERDCRSVSPYTMSKRKGQNIASAKLSEFGKHVWCQDDNISSLIVLYRQGKSRNLMYTSLADLCESNKQLYEYPETEDYIIGSVEKGLSRQVVILHKEKPCLSDLLGLIQEKETSQ